MIRYDFIRTGPFCYNRCPFCLERDGNYLEAKEILADVENATEPYNLYFGEGDAAGSPHLISTLEFVRTMECRRIKVKTTGTPLLSSDRLNTLINIGVYLFEIECLGPNAGIHDEIAGRKGAFKDMCKSIKAIKWTKLHTSPIKTPFLFITVPVCEQNVMHLMDITNMVLKYDPDRIVFCYAGLPSISKVTTNLRACITYTMLKQVWPVLSGFPFCTLMGLEYHCQEIYDRQILNSFYDFCNGCVMRNVCPGIKEEYLDVFGSAEFKTIRWHPHSEAIKRIIEI